MSTPRGSLKQVFDQWYNRRYRARGYPLTDRDQAEKDRMYQAFLKGRREALNWPRRL